MEEWPQQCFKAYDIRGTYPDQIEESIARKIGFSFATFLKAKTLVVGRDMRTMAPSIQEQPSCATALTMTAMANSMTTPPLRRPGTSITTATGSAASG